MIVGIITQPLENNYGGIIQNYALQRVLKILGHNPITIDQPSSYPLSFKYYFLPDTIECLKNIARWILGKPTVTLPSINTYKYSHHKNDLSNFRNTHIKCTDKLFQEDQIRQFVAEQGIEALVVGSDQVWRPKYNLNIYNSFFRFAIDYNIIKVAYAASFGTDKWEFSNKQEKECRNLLKLFSGVSVREFSAIKICEDHFKISPKIVLDPALLICREEYEEIVKEANVPRFNGDIFCYFLDVNSYKIRLAEKISHKNNLQLFSVLSPTYSIKQKLDIITRPPVEKWLRAFMDAKYVICDSFHGVIFSLIFNKDFMVVLNEDRGKSRFDSIIDLFGISSNVIVNNTNLDNVDFIKNNWNEINKKKDLLKNESISFINSILK